MKCCDMHAGMLNEVISFERSTRTSDGSGGFTEEWAAITGAPTRAAVKALSGSERFASDRIEAISKWRITSRYFSDIKENDRVIIRSRAYNIRFVNNVELADRWLEIDLSGGVAV